MNNDHLTGPMLSASMDEVIRLRTRIEALEAALREITSFPYTGEDNAQRMVLIARSALASERGK